jgi:hypothetical protein
VTECPKRFPRAMAWQRCQARRHRLYYLRVAALGGWCVNPQGPGSRVPRGYRELLASHCPVGRLLDGGGAARTVREGSPSGSRRSSGAGHVDVRSELFDLLVVDPCGSGAQRCHVTVRHDVRDAGSVSCVSPGSRHRHSHRDTKPCFVSAARVIRRSTSMLALMHSTLARIKSAFTVSSRLQSVTVTAR